MENEDKSFVVRRLMTYGAIIGAMLSVYVFVVHLQRINVYTDTSGSFLTQLPQLILAFGIYFSLRNFEKITQIRLNFGRFILLGTLVGFFTSIIYSAFFAIFATKIAPDTLTFFVKFIDEFSKSGFSAEQLNNSKDFVQQPLVLFISFLFSNIFVSFIISFFFAILNLIFPKPKIS